MYRCFVIKTARKPQRVATLLRKQGQTDAVSDRYEIGYFTCSKMLNTISRNNNMPCHDRYYGDEFQMSSVLPNKFPIETVTNCLILKLVSAFV